MKRFVTVKPEDELLQRFLAVSEAARSYKKEASAMAITTFGAIYIGSYEVSLKIFELSQRKQLRTVDHIRSRVELGKDVFASRSIGYELVEELCLILKEFRKIMDGYRVDDYQAYASVALHHVSNELFVLDQIWLRTKIRVQILSNSERRFIGYKALAFRPEFEEMIKESAALVDVGGGSMQITLFRKGKAVTTQHIELGIMRIKERLSGIEAMVAHYEKQIQEMVDKELESFKHLYLSGKDTKYIILLGDYIGDITKGVERKKEDGTIEQERFLKKLKKFRKKSAAEESQELDISNEDDPLMIPSAVLYKRTVEEINAEYVWLPGADISDGIAYDYAQSHKILKPEHNFEEDILSAAKALAQRYESYSKHTEALLETSLAIFDAMKNVHGLAKRDRLLLQAAVILHDCGKYISLVNQAECSYQIIMASEIIGMTHLEREIVASAVKYNSNPLASYEELADKMNQDSYMAVAKLAAILKIANALDRSHKQKFRNVKAALKDRQLLITVEAKESLVLERGLFSVYADAFERIFSVKPCIREKRMFQ